MVLEIYMTIQYGMLNLLLSLADAFFSCTTFIFFLEKTTLQLATIEIEIKNWRIASYLERLF